MFGHTPFAWRNITHRKVRSLVALSGVSFSVLLIFMQVGFYFAVLESATAVYRAMDADVFLVSPLYVFIGHAAVIPRERLYQAAGVDGVKDAVPFYTDIKPWRNSQTRLRHLMMVMGVDPSVHLFNLSADTAALLRDGQILIDSLNRPIFGAQDTGLKTEILGRQVEIAGQYTIGPGFATDGAAMMSDDTFIRTMDRRIDRPSIGIIRVQAGRDPVGVSDQLRRVVPRDTRVFTKTEMIRREEAYWIRQTAIGPVFGAGALLGLLIGTIVVYQVMVTDITNRIREYATLKAIGYESVRLRFIVLKEASIFSVAGFIVGGLFSAVLYKVLEHETGLPMSIDPLRSAVILALTFLMCWTAGLLGTRKLRRAGPADLF